jgi:hypothetical protein
MWLVEWGRCWWIWLWETLLLGWLYLEELETSLRVDFELWSSEGDVCDG